MQIRHLKVFCDVAATRSFSRGAALNRVTQSAATQVVRQLEKRLGVDLFDRSKRPPVLSPAGQICFQGYREVIDRCTAIQDQVRTRREELSGRIRVAAIYSIGLYAMNRSMQAYMLRYPQVKIHLEFLPPQRVYDEVRRHEVDLGLVSYPKAARGLGVIPLRDEQMALVCSPTHRLARIKRLGIDQLEGEAFVAFDSGLIIRREIDGYLRRHHVKVDVTMEFDNIETIKQAVEIGAGVSILPWPTVAAEVERRTLAVAPLAIEELRRPLGIIHRSSRPFTPSIARFVELLKSSQDHSAAL